MQIKKGTYLLLFCITTIVSCVKYADNPDSGTGTGGGTVSDTITSIKFFNVVDQGKIRIKLNGSFVTDSLATYYPSAYITAKADSNNIQLYKVTSLDTVLLINNFLLQKGKKYSGFIYKQGYDWKVSFVTDNLTAPDSGYAGIRILDFRTQAITNYVSIRLFSLGYFTYGDVSPYVYRHFLDFTSYDFVTQFIPVYSRPDYNIVVYNSSANLSSRSGINLQSKKLYSIILMTPASITSDTTANKYLFSGVQQHN